jgi:hypothetical protein
MIRSHESDGSNSKGTYLYHKIHYTSKYKYTYVWYEQNGVKRMETKKEKLAEPRTKATEKKSTTPIQSKPANITKPQEPPVKVAQPVFTKSKPADVGQFVFDTKEPIKREVLVPQPPPVPGPAPVFNTVTNQSKSKFEYLYGIKNLEVKHTQYENKSVYISKPINAAGNVMQVSLNAIEEHPLFDTLNGKAADRQTSIEYYIASVGTNPNPTLDEWYPILPEGQKTVKSELLMFGTARTAELRFPALIGSKERPVVYRNGLALEDDEWSFADGGTRMQLLIDKDPTAIYTIDYTPNAEFYNPWFIDVNQANSRPVKHTQVFENGTNHNKTVVLEKYPYINYELINTTDGYDQNLSEYVPIKVKLQEASIIGPSRVTYKEVLPFNNKDQFVFTKNITNYKTGYNEPLKPYSIDPDTLYNGFEYYHEGDKLYFSETFNKADIHTNLQESHGNAKIVVEYEYLSSDFRMKIILRRNSTDENTLTPIVHDYTLKFRVMK